MKVTYVEHSSFLVEMKRHYLLFDYFQGEIPKMDPKKELLVFASHRHGDHFSPVIFELAKEYPRIHYVISDDIWENRVPMELHGKVTFMGAEEEETIGDVEVKTYRSTDEGVAFLLSIEGKTIYHAGDLNHWNWMKESDEWNRQMGARYHKELDKMAGEKIHLAFLPMDSRLNENFYLGVDDFMKRVGAEVVFPMHFWEDYSVGRRLKELPCSLEYRDRIREIHGKGETFFVE
ncbi:MAG: MBL fold metallo-hydrolase [Hungatella sp.]